MLPKKPEDALSPHEKRSSDRKKLIVDVKFEGGDATGIANTRDIGIGGLYIITDADLETGSDLSIQMTFGGADFSVDGVVAYIDKGVGVGVRFRDLSYDQLTLLKRELAVG